MATERGRVRRRSVLKMLGLGGVALTGGCANVTGRLRSRTPTTLYDFDTSRDEFPENVAIDSRGYKYVSVPPLGEIWAFSPEDELVAEPFATFPVSGDMYVGVVGLEVDPGGTVYACFASDLDPATRNSATNGVWAVRGDQEPVLYAELPPTPGNPATFPNDIALLGDAVLVTDSFRGVVYRAWPGGEVEVWASGPLLEPEEVGLILFGADGIAVGIDGAVYVSNWDKGLLVKIPVEQDGSAGVPDVFVEDESLLGSDGLAFDVRGNLYVAVNDQNAIRRVSPSGDIETLAEGGDLDGPSDVTFGTISGQQTTIYITNLTSMVHDPDAYSKPSFMKLDVGVSGLPIRR